MDRNACYYVAGGDTLLGRALRGRLGAAGCHKLVGCPPDEPDLTCAGQVEDFFAEYRPDYIFLAAGCSGGIRANERRPAELMLDNLLTATHVLDQSHRHRVRKLLYLASSCAYPKHAPQPMRVEALLTGPLEPTSEAYATAKLAGWKLCQAYRRQYGANFITAIPANPFGPGDNFDPESGHVIPSLIRRLHTAKEFGEDVVTLWGTGKPVREFVYAPDLADACLFLMDDYDSDDPINIGSSLELSIDETAKAVAGVVAYRGRIRFDPSQPDGMPRKVLDTSRLFALGWRPMTEFTTALEETYAWFLAHECQNDPAVVRATL